MISKRMWNFCIQKPLDLFIECCKKDKYELYQDSDGAIHISKDDLEYIVNFSSYDDYLEWNKTTPEETVLKFKVFEYEHFDVKNNYIISHYEFVVYKEVFDTIYKDSHIDFATDVLKELFSIRDNRNV